MLLYGYPCIWRCCFSAESVSGPFFRVPYGLLQDEEGFNLGYYNNFIQIFGYYRWHWFLPVYTRWAAPNAWSQCWIAQFVVLAIYGTCAGVEVLCCINIFLCGRISHSCGRPCGSHGRWLYIHMCPVDVLTVHVAVLMVHVAIFVVHVAVSVDRVDVPIVHVDVSVVHLDVPMAQIIISRQSSGTVWFMNL